MAASLIMLIALGAGGLAGGAYLVAASARTRRNGR
jgi:hypothetical protein